MPSARKPFGRYALLPLCLAGFRCIASPDNDDFERRISVSGPEISLRAYLLDATLEANENQLLTIDGEPAQKSAWWSWVPPRTGYAAVIYQGTSTCDQGIAFFRGSSLNGLTPVMAIGSGIFPVEEGVNYHLAAWSQCTEATPDVAEFVVRNLSSFGYDEFDSRVYYSEAKVSAWGQTVDKTRDAGEPVHGGVGQGPSEWWNWQPTESGLATIRIRGYGFSPILAAYVGDQLAALAQVSQQIDEFTWVWPATAGTTYHVAVCGKERDEAGVYEMGAAISPMFIAAPPTGSDFADPSEIAVRLEGVPLGGIPTVYWETIAGLRGQATGQPSSPIVLTDVPRGEVTLRATCRVGTMIYASPPIFITVYRRGDDFADAIVAEGQRFASIGDLGGATVEANEPPIAGSRPGTIWWHWTAPVDAFAFIQVDNAPQFSAFEVQADGGLVLQPLTVVEGFPGVPALAARRGATYAFRAAAEASTIRAVNLQAQQLLRPANDDQTNATQLVSEGGLISGNNSFATTEPDELPRGFDRSVWYDFEANQTGAWNLDLRFSATTGWDSYPQLRLFQKSTDMSWELIGHHFPVGPWRIGVEAGIHYRLSVEGPAAEPLKDFALAYGPVKEVVNDRSENALTLQTPVQFTTSLTNAAHNFNELGPSLWWKWRAPRNGTGTVTFSAPADSSDELAAIVYRQMEGTNLLFVSPRSPWVEDGALAIVFDGRRVTTFPAESGADYLIAVRPKYSGIPARPFTMGLDFTSAQVEVIGTASPFQVRLSDFDPLVENHTAGVAYGRVSQFFSQNQSSASVPPFAAEVDLGQSVNFVVRAYMTNVSGDLRVIDSAPISVLPRNDEPSGAVRLSAWAPRISGSGDNATYSVADPPWTRVQVSGLPGGSLWYRWTSPITGTVLISGGGVYDQKLFLSGRPVETQWPGSEVNVRAGQEYRFSVSGPSTNQGVGDFGLGFWYEMRFEIPPLIELESPESGVVYRSGSAVPLSAKLLLKPEGFQHVEFLVTEAFSQHPLLSVEQEPFSTNWIPAAGGVYGIAATIRLDNGWIVGTTTNRTITVLPSNDAFANRKPLEGYRVSWEVLSDLATLEPGELSLTGIPSARSLWWYWSAPESGEVEVTLVRRGAITGSAAVYQGDRLEALRRVSITSVEKAPSPESGFFGALTITFSAQAWNQYVLVVEDAGTVFAPIRATLRLRALPRNDNFQAGGVLAGLAAAAEGSNLGTTREFGEPRHANSDGGRSVWYRWIAPATGNVNLSITGTLSAPALAVYRGADLATLIPVASTAASSTNAALSFAASGGTEYRIAIDGVSGATGDFVFSLTLFPTPPELRLEYRRISGEALELQIVAAEGREVTVSGSPDLIHWEPLATAQPNPNGVASVRFEADQLSDLYFLRASSMP
ncbi:MAG TPA: hypothetical protein PLX89_02120 [Verrucomicrobiota bacterium]|nr:hypothetical protein [Verrucomicrobiota bacterium]